jgi:hypothetical protein
MLEQARWKSNSHCTKDRIRPKADLARTTRSQLTGPCEQLRCYFLSPVGKKFIGFHALTIEPGKTPSHCSSGQAPSARQSRHLHFQTT